MPLLALATLPSASVLVLTQPGNGRHTAPRRVDQRLGLAARHLPGWIARASQIPAPALHDPAQLSRERCQQVRALAEVDALGSLNEVVEQEIGMLPSLLLQIISVSHGVRILRLAMRPTRTVGPAPRSEPHRCRDPRREGRARRGCASRARYEARDAEGMGEGTRAWPSSSRPNGESSASR
jgi:hypothetical protein